MDTIKLIRQQIRKLRASEKSMFLESIMLHLERAESYYNLGEKDFDYYNDVLYRTNQAYEGALKEAFKVLADKSEEEVIKESPFKIENFFEVNNIFKERILQLFRNYRSEWRNKSTHDYRLFFDKHEAFMALSSVSSFTYLLLDQIIEKVAFEYEKEKIASSPQRPIKFGEEGKLKVSKGLFEILMMNLSEVNIEDLKSKVSLEAELMGFLKATMSSFFPQSLITYEDARLNGSLRPDFIIELQSEKVIVEVKKIIDVVKIDPLISQLLAYFRNSDITQGILFIINTSHGLGKLSIEERLIELNDIIYRVGIITN